MKTRKQGKKIMIFFFALLALLGVFLAYQILYLRKAHSTFENYYKFRGCTQLLQKTDNYGICKTIEGTAIKIVKYKDRWYLSGDLPVCLFHICF